MYRSNKLKSKGEASPPPSHGLKEGGRGVAPAKTTTTTDDAHSQLGGERHHEPTGPQKASQNKKAIKLAKHAGEARQKAHKGQESLFYVQTRLVWDEWEPFLNTQH